MHSKNTQLDRRGAKAAETDYSEWPENLSLKGDCFERFSPSLFSLRDLRVSAVLLFAS